jgi:hypothetical protein
MGIITNVGKTVRSVSLPCGRQGIGKFYICNSSRRLPVLPDFPA